MATLDRPSIEQRTLEDLVHDVQRGVVRIPQFQRGFAWEARDVVKLFDSIFRGYPIGTLLLWRRAAPAQTLHVGPLTIEAPELDSALWVADGQQRITSLVGALSAAHTATDARFRIHLDLDTGEFRAIGARQEPLNTWIPVSFLLQTATLLRWVRENDDWLSDAQIALAEQAAHAIRDYRFPVYVVTASDERFVREIFLRVNTAGMSLTRTEVFEALHAQASGDAPVTLATIGRVPAETGFGVLDDQLVLRCVLAYRGHDIFGSAFMTELESAEDQTDTLHAVGSILRDVVAFLRDHAEIPHVKLLPYSNVIPVLVRFVRLHGAPTGRAATLLRRWVWRSAVAGTRAMGQSVADVRGQIDSVQQSDPVAAAGALLERVPANTRFTVELDRVHFNHAMTKINILCLWFAEPRDPATGTAVEIARLLEEGSPLQPIFTDTDLALSHTMANRVIAPDPALGLRTDLARAPIDVAESHLINKQEQALLAAPSPAAFLERRAAKLTDAFEWYVDRMAEWGARDGQSIADLLRTG